MTKLGYGGPYMNILLLLLLILDIHIDVTFSLVTSRGSDRRYLIKLRGLLSTVEDEGNTNTNSEETEQPTNPQLIIHKKQVEDKGYRFGDISKSVFRKVTDSVNELTGDEEYRFGNVSRWLDRKAKAEVNKLSGKETYEFGDLSRWIDARVKDKINDYTGEKEYKLGDISKTIVHELANKEYTIQDMILLCKLLISFGTGLSPVAEFLPTQLLLEMLNFSILQETGDRLIGALTLELDKRAKEALVGDAAYKFGDITMNAINSFVGKNYEFGDISKKVLGELNDKNKVVPELLGATVSSVKHNIPKYENLPSLKFDADLMKALKEWDDALTVANKAFVTKDRAEIVASLAVKASNQLNKQNDESGKNEAKK